VGSSGERRREKTKNRGHLPKVGTPADQEWERHEHLDEVLHPFSDEPDRPRSRTATIITVAIVIVVALVVIFGLVALT
jgi:hypothetical protein